MHDYKRILGRLAHYSFVNNDANISESIRPNQIESKTWLVYEITKFKNDFKRVAVMGSWNSILLYEFMSDVATVGSWDFYDIDIRCHEDRDKYFNSNGININYNSYSLDATLAMSDESIASQYDLIINPSCEHMSDIEAIPGPMYALTSNNYSSLKEHVNTIGHYEDLAVKNKIDDILYEGELKFENYDRYCTIGYRRK